MAKKKSAKEKRGPYLATAVFCDNVLREHDGTISAIRMVDQVRIGIPANAPADVPSKEKRVQVITTGLLCFKTGDYPGSHKIRIVMESPDGKISEQQERMLEFTPHEHGGGNLIFPTSIMVYRGGLFWFNVYLDDKLMTRMPLAITIERQQPTPDQPAPQAGNASTPAPAADSSPARKNGERRRKKA
ncbi:MAG TPA: hypothetical protein VG099_31665 [Gemmataceae bacterium]|nr:hypothetical protein [Gemmataceae bacterium]